jgi:hypothetical protein
MDFTLKIYQQLLLFLQQAGYGFLTFEQFCQEKENLTSKTVVLRHDVDLKAENSLATAKIEAALSIRATYFFRIVPQSDKPTIIREIAALGHEIGYHYEDMSLFGGDAEKAIEHFNQRLDYFRQYYPVRTICMHGSPTSKIDNRSIWKKYNYRDYGIIGEPYFDIDFNKVLYLTDTGRSWDGERFSVRDKVESVYDFHFKSTNDIIHAIQSGSLPEQIMITTHPQRWTNSFFRWLYELFFQFIKNKIKQYYMKI